MNIQLFNIPKISSIRGDLSVLEAEKQLPFKISRTYWISNVPSGQTRGGHAHKTCHQIIIAITGSFNVEVDNGFENHTFSLNNPDTGLYIPPGTWDTESEFSPGAICLVLASEPYKEDDYIRNYKDFIAFRKNENSKI